MARNILIFIYLLAVSHFAQAQANDPSVLVGRGPFSHADSLRGQVSPERAAIDVTSYDLNITLKPSTKSIIGKVVIDFTAVAPINRLQFDLYENLIIDRSDYQLGEAEALRTEPIRDGNTFYLPLKDPLSIGQRGRVEISYHGIPQEAKNPPWDGGFVWAKDANGNPWVSVACEGAGASLWWPCKDDPSDEPDSTSVSITWIGKGLPIANGRLVKMLGIITKPEDQRGTYSRWRVRKPINLYNVNITIGDFAHIHDVYKSKVTGDTLALDYYVLKGNEQKARTYFAEEVKPMLDVFEKHFGPYPWYNDGFKLVETPYWGMEHQSSIAYGNDYKRLPAPFNFDFIIVHESGHEWFGNSISMGDGSDMWLHETFTSYSEWVYLEALRGKEAALEYRLATRQNIENKEQIQGPRGVNYEGWESSDMYYKGAWMLHTIRSHYFEEQSKYNKDPDQYWWDFVRSYYDHFKGKIIYTEDAIDFFADKLGKDVRPILRQYLNYAALPVLEYEISTSTDGHAVVKWRFNSPVPDFKLNLRFKDGRTWQYLPVSTQWTEHELVYQATDFLVDTDNQLIEAKNLGAK